MHQPANQRQVDGDVEPVTLAVRRLRGGDVEQREGQGDRAPVVQVAEIPKPNLRILLVAPVDGDPVAPETIEGFALEVDVPQTVPAPPPEYP